MNTKILIGFLLTFSVLVSYSQTEVRPTNGPRGVVNKRDELNRRQESWRTYNYEGDLLSEIEYKNDKKEGKYVIYYPGGGEAPEKIKEESQCFDGRLDGNYVKKYFSGQAAVEGVYNLGLKEGIWKYYYEDGQVKAEGNYIKGKRDGEWKRYNRKGVLISTVTYKDGVDVRVAAEQAKQASAGQTKMQAKKK